MNAPTHEKHPLRHLFSGGPWVALLLYYALTIPHLRYIPLWDSMENLEEYLFLPREHLYFYDLLLMHNGHPSLGYFWPFWIGQWLFPSRMIVVHLINLAIGSLAIVAFNRIAANAFRDMASRCEITLLTVAFAVQPVFVAYALNMSPDYGLLTYFLATLWLLGEGRYDWAALTGLMLLFSKETGVPTYALLVMLHLSGALRKYRWREVLPLAIPFVFFAIYCSYQLCKQRPIFPWAARWLGQETFLQIYLPNPLKSDFKMACLGPFVLEFQWIFTAVIVAGLIAGILARLPKNISLAEMKEWLRGINPPMRNFLFLLAGCLYLESRTVVFTNQRYFFPLYPLMLLLFLAAIVQLRIAPRPRSVVLGAAIALLFACNFRTLDPLSRKITGTFDFGSHKLLSIATMRPDVGDMNRDQMVYNQEHMHISDLMDMAFEKIRPTDGTVLSFSGESWWMISRLDVHTFHRTESTRPPFYKPAHFSAENIVGTNDRPPLIYAFFFPNFDNQKMLQCISPYDILERHVFSEDGYEIHVWKMALKKQYRPVASTGGD